MTKRRAGLKPHFTALHRALMQTDAIPSPPLVPTQPAAAEINEVSTLFLAGNDAEAARLAQDLTVRYPQHGFGWLALGMLLNRKGNYPAALAHLQTATTLLPDDADALNNLGITLHSLGRSADAAESLRRAIGLRHEFADAHNNLGIVLRALGALDDSLNQFQLALASRPDFPEAHNNLGITLRDLGRSAEAEQSFLRSLALKPDTAEALNNLALALIDQGRLPEAESHLRRALTIKPDYVEAINSLGITLKELSRMEEAASYFAMAIRLQPNYINAHANLAISLMELGKMSEAESHLRRALMLAPGIPEIHSNLGRTLAELGRLDEAEQSLRHAITLAPERAAPLIMALLYLPYRRDDPAFAQLPTLYAQRATLPLIERISLDFVMGKAMERIGDYDLAFEAYEEGNRFYAADHPVDDEGDQQILEKSRTIVTADLIQSCAAVAGRFPPAASDRVPIFIVGMLRSGTTLIEQILASHPQVFGAGELTTFWRVADQATAILNESVNAVEALTALRELGQAYLNDVWQQAPMYRFITDKQPNNYYHLWLIQLMLPNAKIIHAERDPMDTCFSCYSLLFKRGNEFAYELGALGRHFMRYRQLMRHWHAVLPPGRILDVRYEDTIADPEHEARRMLDFIGLPWHDNCLRFYETTRTVRTASVTQVRQPIYGSSMARWKHFERQLQPLFDIIEPEYRDYFAAKPV